MSALTNEPKWNRNGTEMEPKSNPISSCACLNMCLIIVCLFVGELKCAVYSDTGVLITEQPLEVRVLGRPRVRINSRTDTVGPGETVSVACRVETPSRMSHPLSSTPPKIEWFRDGHLVQVAGEH